MADRSGRASALIDKVATVPSCDRKELQAYPCVLVPLVTRSSRSAALSRARCWRVCSSGEQRHAELLRAPRSPDGPGHLNTPAHTKAAGRFARRPWRSVRPLAWSGSNARFSLLGCRARGCSRCGVLRVLLGPERGESPRRRLHDQLGLRRAARVRVPALPPAVHEQPRLLERRRMRVVGRDRRLSAPGRIGVREGRGLRRGTGLRVRSVPLGLSRRFGVPLESALRRQRV